MVGPAWENITLRFSMSFWVSFSLSGRFYFLNNVFTFFKLWFKNLHLKQKKANSFSVYEVGSNCIENPQNTQIRTSCNQACMESRAQNFPWPAAMLSYKQSLRCLQSFTCSEKKLDNAKDLPDGYSISTFV